MLHLLAADVGLDGPLGAGVGLTFLGAVVLILTLLVNALLKTASRSDNINSQLVKAKEKEIERLTASHEADKRTWESDLTAIKQERDMWFERYMNTLPGRQT